MHEVMYKKGYEWISSVAITDCEIIPFGEKPEEKMKKLSEEYKKVQRQETEDDFLFQEVIMEILWLICKGVGIIALTLFFIAIAYAVASTLIENIVKDIKKIDKNNE